MEKDKLFELMTKMYSDFSKRFDNIENEQRGIKNDITGIKNEVGDIKVDVKGIKNDIILLENKLEDKTKALFDGLHLAIEGINEMKSEVKALTARLEKQDVEIKVIKGGK